jgi:hypothetical protein
MIFNCRLISKHDYCSCILVLTTLWTATLVAETFRRVLRNEVTFTTQVHLLIFLISCEFYMADYLILDGSHELLSVKCLWPKHRCGLDAYKTNRCNDVLFGGQRFRL